MPCYCIPLRLLSEYEGNPGHNVVFWRCCPTSQPRPSSHNFSQILGKDWAIQIFPDGLHNQCRRLLFLSSLRPPGELVISSSTSCLQAWYIPDTQWLPVRVYRTLLSPVVPAEPDPDIRCLLHLQ